MNKCIILYPFLTESDVEELKSLGLLSEFKHYSNIVGNGRDKDGNIIQMSPGQVAKTKSKDLERKRYIAYFKKIYATIPSEFNRKFRLELAKQRMKELGF